MLHPMSLDGSRSGRLRDRVTILILILLLYRTAGTLSTGKAAHWFKHRPNGLVHG
jgi:hypothetical protein